MLELKDIQVKYSYKSVLNGISLQFREGKIYSLLGENGAGKSTLAKVICGSVRPTAGTLAVSFGKGTASSGGSGADVSCPVSIGGAKDTASLVSSGAAECRPVSFKSPHDALRCGICCVQQRPALAPGVTVLENLKLGQTKFEEREAAALLAEWFPFSTANSSIEGLLRERVENLSLEERFFVSLVNALLKKPRVLILDEPPYVPPEKLRALASSGMIIILITHHLRESLQKSDRIILLQDGLVLEEKDASQVSEEYIAEKLYGLNPAPASEKDFIRCELTEDEFFKEFGGKSGVGYIPSDIAFRASNPELTILQLLTARHCNLRQKELVSYAEKLLKKADVNIRLNEKASCLSGGMLQRLVLERELAEHPSELYLFNPAHGLDVQATERLFARLKTLAEGGTKVYFGRSAEAQ